MCLWRWESSPPLLLGAVCFSLAGSLENVRKSIVAFVAGELIDGSGHARERIFDHPGFGKHGRVLDRCAVEKRVAVDRLETLDYMEILRRAHEFRLRVEISSIDDKRLTLPVTDRIAQPLTNVRADMLLP